MNSFKTLYRAAVAVSMIFMIMAQEHGYGQEEYAYPKYSFEYQVKDDHTKDIKSQHETRDGHSVKGFYSLLQPDGKTRTVQYTADEKLGFNAIVNYEGGSYGYAPAPAPAPAPAQAAAPAPQAYSGGYEPQAPLASYSAPQPKYHNTGYSKASVSTPHFSYSY